MDFELTKSQKEIQKAAREFAKGEFDKELALELDRTHEFPTKIWKKAADLGFIGVHYPEKYSGQDLRVLVRVRPGPEVGLVELDRPLDRLTRRDVDPVAELLELGLGCPGERAVELGIFVEAIERRQVRLMNSARDFPTVYVGSFLSLLPRLTETN